MKRRLFNLAAVVSFLFFVTFLAMWQRSFRRIDDLLAFSAQPWPKRAFVNFDIWSHRTSYCHVGIAWSEGAPANEGSARFTATPTWQGGSFYDIRMGDVKRYMLGPEHVGSFSRWGFSLRRSLPDLGEPTSFVVVPYWALTAMTFALPIHWMAARLLRRPVEAGRCSHCGYDLRESPDRCSECGTPV